VKADETGVLLGRWDANVLILDASASFRPAPAKAGRSTSPSKAQRVLAMDERRRCRSEADATREPTSRRFEIVRRPAPKRSTARRDAFHVQPRFAEIDPARLDAVGSIATGIKHGQIAALHALRNRPTPGVDGGKETGMITKPLQERGSPEKHSKRIRTFDGGQVDGNDTSFFVGENGFRLPRRALRSYGPRRAWVHAFEPAARDRAADDGRSTSRSVARAGQPPERPASTEKRRRS